MKPNGAFGSSGGTAIELTLRQKYRDAELKIGELEREKAKLSKEKEWLHQRLSYLLVSVNAIGRHFKLPPEEYKKIVDEYIAEQEVDQREQIRIAKEKFIEDMQNGKKPEFRVVDNRDANAGLQDGA